MNESRSSFRLLVVGAGPQSPLKGRFLELGWSWEEAAIEAWLDQRSSSGPWDAVVVDATGLFSPEHWLGIHHMVPHVSSALILAVDGPVPLAFHYPRSGGRRIALLPANASTDVVRSIVNLARDAHRMNVSRTTGDDPLASGAREDLVVHLRRIAEEVYASLSLVNPSSAYPPAAQTPLGDREREVLELLFTGCSLAGLATQLGISESTVKKHVHSIYRKRGVSSRAELMAQGRERNLGPGLSL